MFPKGCVDSDGLALWVEGEALAEGALGTVTAGPGPGETPAFSARQQRDRAKI